MAAKKRKRKPKAFWERGYNGHVYWQGKAKLGKVTRVGEADPKSGRYQWEAAGRTGRCETLLKARSAVELAAVMADRQLPLFED